MARKVSYSAALASAIGALLPALSTTGVWSPAALAVVALFSAWSAEASLDDRFEDARDSYRRLWPRRRAPGRTYNGFAMALVRVGQPLVALFKDHFRSLVLRFDDALVRVEGWRVFAVDGSRVEAPRTASNERTLGRAGRKKTGPQFMLTVLWQVGLGQLWDYRIGPGVTSERRHLDAMIGRLPHDALLVADAGFASHALLERMQREGRSFLLRVGGNLRLLRGLMDVEVAGPNVVHLWPDEKRRLGRRPVAVRLVVVGEGANKIFLATDLDADRLSDQEAARIYRMRWGVETFFRGFKQTLARRKLRSNSPERATYELHWLMLGYWLLGLHAAAALVERGHAPGSWSVALARKAARAALRTNSAREWTRRLGRARREERPRTSSKEARDWPHKKHDPPCGPPDLRDADATQRRAAQRLYAMST